MRLSPMMLAKFLAGAGGVEVAEGDKFQSMQFMIPMEHPLKHELALAVRIDRSLGQIFRHRHTVRGPISGTGRTEDELFDFFRNGCFQKFESVGDVIAKVLSGISHRFAYQRT